MTSRVYETVLCTWRLTASVVNDADGVINVKLTVEIVNYAVNRQSWLTVTPLFTIVIYGAIFEWRRMCTTLIWERLGYMRTTSRVYENDFRSIWERRPWYMKTTSRAQGHSHMACKQPSIRSLAVAAASGPVQSLVACAWPQHWNKHIPIWAHSSDVPFIFPVQNLATCVQARYTLVK